MNKMLFVAGAAIVSVAAFYFFLSRSNEKKAAKDLDHYCGSCHLPPSPGDFSKHTWKTKILPDMGARLGMRVDGYDPYREMTFEEQRIVMADNPYPEYASLGEKQWNHLQKYILKYAPDSLAPEKARAERNASLSLFRPKAMSLQSNLIPAVTALRHPPDHSSFIVGDIGGNVFESNGAGNINKLFAISLPVASFIKKEKEYYVLGIGKMPLSELKTGKLFRFDSSGVGKLYIDRLHNPVFFEMADLNGNGEDEIIFCEYGKRTGGLSLYYKGAEGDGYMPKTLLPAAGMLKAVAVDMNGDGLKDIVALQGRGDEGIHVFYQEKNLQFSHSKVISLRPGMGSNWFELVDYNGDGHLDIALVCGGNDKYPEYPKPYHGLKIYLNDGINHFKEEFFYPIYGATRVMANDFDGDGDIDFAINSFYPDFEFGAEESFVYLENRDAQNFEFHPHTFEQSANGRWRVMEQGDFDGDGDTDLVIGSFTIPAFSAPDAARDRWGTEDGELIFLENQLH